MSQLPLKLTVVAVVVEPGNSPGPVMGVAPGTPMRLKSDVPNVRSALSVKVRKRVGYHDQPAANHRNRSLTNRGIIEPLLGIAGVNFPVEQADAIGANSRNHPITLRVQPGVCVSLPVHCRLDERVDDRRDVIANASIGGGDRPISELLINRIAEVVLNILISVAVTLPPTAAKKRPKFF